MDKKQTAKVPLTQYIERFHAKFQTGLEAITEAAKIYAEAVREYPATAREKFHAAYPAVSNETWEKLRLVGNGDIHPALMLCTDRIGLRLARLPREEQDRLFRKQSVKCLNVTTGEAEEIGVADLKPRHLSVLLDGDKVRTIAEQRKCAAKMAKEREVAPAPPYRIEGSLLVVTRACRIGRNELVAILAKLGGGK